MTEQAKGYPVILGGDHAEFELEHANTPLKERPDWPLPSFDARDWAKAFCKIFMVQKIAGYDTARVDDAEGLMITWFANALMRGFDEHTSRSAAEITRLRAERDRLLAALKECEDTLSFWIKRDNPDWNNSAEPKSVLGHARAAVAAVEEAKR